MLLIFVLAVLYLTEGLGIAGNRCGIIGPVFLLCTTLALQTEELCLLFLGDVLEQFAGTLRGYVFAVRMAMQLRPFAKPVQRILIL